MEQGGQFNPTPENVVKISEIEKRLKSLGLVDDLTDTDGELREFIKKLKPEEQDEIRDCYLDNFRNKRKPSRLQIQLAALEMEDSREDSQPRYDR